MDKNICVVGAGYWGKNHIRTLHQLGALKGIVESDIKILRKFVREKLLLINIERENFAFALEKRV